MPPVKKARKKFTDNKLCLVYFHQPKPTIDFDTVYGRFAFYNILLVFFIILSLLISFNYYNFNKNKPNFIIC